MWRCYGRRNSDLGLRRGMSEGGCFFSAVRFGADQPNARPYCGQRQKREPGCCRNSSSAGVDSRHSAACACTSAKRGNQAIERGVRFHHCAGEVSVNHNSRIVWCMALLPTWSDSGVGWESGQSCTYQRDLLGPFAGGMRISRLPHSADQRKAARPEGRAGRRHSMSCERRGELGTGVERAVRTSRRCLRRAACTGRPGGSAGRGRGVRVPRIRPS